MFLKGSCEFSGAKYKVISGKRGVCFLNMFNCLGKTYLTKVLFFFCLFVCFSQTNTLKREKSKVFEDICKGM